MTAVRKKRLANKIQESRGRLMESHPFFSLMLMYMKYVAVADMKKISTNGRCIYFSPSFLEKLNYNEIDYILCHQIMHIICGHIWRSYDMDNVDYHFACDLIVNSQLSKYGFWASRYPHLGYVYIKIPGEEEDMLPTTADEVYKRLPYSLYILDEQTRDKFLIDNDSRWEEKDEYGRIGEVIIDFPEMEVIAKNKPPENAGGSGAGDGEGKELRHEWKLRIANGVKFVKNIGSFGKGKGDIPEFIKRIFENSKKTYVDWKKILNNFVQESTCDYSFSPPDRRFSETDFFLPDFNEKDFVTKEILFMADTSGSIDNETLGMIYSELKGAIEQFGGKLKGKLGFFDAAVTPPLPFENISDLMSIVPYGGGGTNFEAVFCYVRDELKCELPGCIVIFTDGLGHFPPEFAAMGIPVLWIIYDTDITPPWGVVARIPPRSAGNDNF